ncbi:MAG: ABC transporter permease [Phycisphaerae bacterium]|nr:ABC transporter permease [Phycisphaerae bacterium]
MRLLPFEYAVRNLGRSRLRLTMSLLGSTLVVMLVIAATAFVRGMERSLVQSGSRHNVVLLGAGSEESIERSEVKASIPGQAAASIRGIKTRLGVSYISPEVHMALGVGTSAAEESNSQAVFRGVTPAAFMVHPQVRIVEGRTFDPGEDEVIVGALAATRLGISEDKLAVGQSIWLDRRQWKIVGRFSAPSTVMDAEVWCPLVNLQILTKRDSLSCVVITMGEGEFADADAFAARRVDLELVAMRETDYYGKVVDFYRPVRMMVWATAVLIALGGIFGGLNTMYAAFASRVREIGMLQSLGYPRRAVVICFVQESVLAAAAGALIAAALSLLLLDGLAVRFSMGAFGLVFDGPTIGLGLASGLLLGIIGSLPPAIRCFRMQITEALKAA